MCSRQRRELGCSQDRGTHTRPTHWPSWVGAEMDPKVGGEPSTPLGSPWLVRPSSRTLSGVGLGSRGGDVSTDSPHLPVRDGRDGSRRVSAHARQQLLQVLSCPGHPASQLRHHLAGQGPSSGGQLGVQVTHFAQGKTGSQALQPRASSTGRGRADVSQHRPRGV